MEDFYFVENVGNCCNNWFATEKALEIISKLANWSYEETSRNQVIGFSHEEAIMYQIALSWSEIQVEIYTENNELSMLSKWEVRKQMTECFMPYQKIKRVLKKGIVK